MTESDMDAFIESIPMVSLSLEFSPSAFNSFEETFGSQEPEDTDQLNTWEVIGREEFDFEIELL